MSVPSSSLDALDGFCVLANSSSGHQCVLLIRQVLKHPQIFVFGELLACNSITQLQGTEHQPWLDLLRLFAYGTFKDYKSASPPLPDLSSSELLKLKSLTLISLASSTRSHSLPYSLLLTELDLPSQRDLESLVIQAISASLLSARLDQRRQLVEVDACIGRDVAPGEVSEMRGAVGSWLAQVEDVMAALEQHMERVKHTQQHNTAVARRDEEERNKVAQLLTAARSGQMSEPPKPGELLNGVRVDATVLQAVQLVSGAGEGKAGKRGDAGGRMGGGGMDKEMRGDKSRKRTGMGGWGFGRG